MNIISDELNIWKIRDNTDVWQAHLQRVFAIHPFYIYNEWQDGHRMWIEEKEV